MMIDQNSLLIDLDGVVYEGDLVVPGAVESLAWLRAQEIPHLFLTNTSSKSRRALVEKLGSMGVDTSENAILTPPVAAARWLRENVEGAVSLFVADGAVDEFAGLDRAAPDIDGEPVAAVVIGDLGKNWSYRKLNRAFRQLMTEPRPRLVALGMTRYWHAPDGLRLDTAPFVVALAHASGIEPTILGKPAEPFFATALEALGSTKSGTWMIGDDIRVDVGGAQDAGLRACLVRTGKFRSLDLELGIQPDFVLDSIASLPSWWDRMESER